MGLFNSHTFKGIVMKLHEFRVKHKLSGMKMATMLGVERQTVYNWEGGKTVAPLFLPAALIEMDRQLSPKQEKRTEEKKVPVSEKTCAVCYRIYNASKYDSCNKCLPEA